MSIEVMADVLPELQITENEVRFYREEGYLYLPGVVPEDVVAELREEVLEVMDAQGYSYADLCNAAGARGKLFQSGQYLEGSRLAGYVNSAVLRSLATQLMEGRATLYLPFSAVKAGGGGGTFHFHQDNQYTRFDGPGINLWMAISPMSPENGCLQVVPRSHLNGTEEGHISPDGDRHRAVAQEPTRFLPVRMRPGDIIAFTRLTIHGSGPNITQEPRLAYATQFHRDDVSAIWDNEPPRRLLDHPRWKVQPVKSFVREAGKSRDGH